MAVLVTGAAGFTGSHLVEHLRSVGVPVVGWSRLDVDLLDRDAVRTHIRALRPDAVYHCAGAPHVGHSWSHTAASLAANVLASHHLFDALERAGCVGPVLNVGSATVYRPTTETLTEEHAVGPDSPYALSKLAQELLGHEVAATASLPVFSTRSFNHTGPRQRAAFAAPAFARQLALIEQGRCEPVLRVGNLDTYRDLTDVRDVVRAYGLIVERGRPGVPYNVCSGRAYSIRELLHGLVARTRVTVRIEQDPALLRPVDTPRLTGSFERLRRDTGWEPSIGIDRMLDDLLGYWRAEVARAT